MANFTGNRRKEITFTVNDRGCHICTSHAIGANGYPQYWWDGRKQTLHHAMYEIANGKLADGILVRHKCDDRACINLDHLESGTPLQNTADMFLRGRQNPPKGERAGNAKLTLVQVEQIRASGLKQTKIAAIYGIHSSHVSRIKSGKVWGVSCA